MDYEVDLDPKHSVIRLTVTAETVSLELLEKIYRHLREVTSRGGPYASIYDISAVNWTALPTEIFKSVLPRRPLMPPGRKHVMVGKEPHISRFASLFHMCTESIGEPAGFILTHVYDSGEMREFQVVYSLEEAYDIVGARPEDFTECLVWPSPLSARVPHGKP